jgi:hypothetical protein
MAAPKTWMQLSKGSEAVPGIGLEWFVAPGSADTADFEKACVPHTRESDLYALPEGLARDRLLHAPWRSCQPSSIVKTSKPIRPATSIASPVFVSSTSREKGSQVL